MVSSVQSSNFAYCSWRKPIGGTSAASRTTGSKMPLLCPRSASSSTNGRVIDVWVQTTIIADAVCSAVSISLRKARPIVMSSSAPDYEVVALQVVQQLLHAI